MWQKVPLKLSVLQIDVLPSLCSHNHPLPPVQPATQSVRRTKVGYPWPWAVTGQFLMMGPPDKYAGL